MEPTVAALRTHLESHARPADARQMEAYMRDLFPFLGIKSPDRKALAAPWISLAAPAKVVDSALILDLWDQPEREFQYIALDMLIAYARKAPEDFIQLYADLITTKSWWDTVDGLAGTCVGALFKRYPEMIPVWVPAWMDSGNIWLQRTCLLFQLFYRQQTDWALMTHLIGTLAGSREFFIQKAIGWVLRQYSKTAPGVVRTYIDTHELAPLSRREGLKWLTKHPNS
ncbi:MAG: DNA alkylation repair protein [Bacteroidia bacterium]|nr:DNA alkylation repair protein [Bacteroidia bacterium]